MTDHTRPEPKAFVDSKGRRWILRITVGVLDRVRDHCGLELIADDLTTPALDRAADSNRFLAELLWLLVEPDAQAEGIQPEDFANGLDGTALLEAMQAMIGALTDFFLHNPAKRELLEKTIEARARILDEAGGRMAAEIDRAVSKENLTKIVDQVIAKASTSLSTESPESSE